MSDELKDMGIEIIDLGSNEQGEPYKKIALFVQFYDDGSWIVDSMDDNGGANATLGNGTNLLEILPVLKEIRETFLKALKEGKQ